MRVGQTSAIDYMQQQSNLTTRSRDLDMARLEQGMDRYKQVLAYTMNNQLRQLEVVNDLKEVALHINTWA
jgi:hypothetical protein